MKHLSQAILLAFISLLIYSCQEEVSPSSEAEEGKLKSVRARLDIRIEPFDVTRAEGIHEWKDGDIIYLIYTTENGTVTSNAVYSAEEKDWTVNYNGHLLRDQKAKVQAYWFDGAGSTSESTLTLHPTTGVYHDANGQYVYTTQGELTISLRLIPYTSRIRFKGTAETDFSIASGVTTCTSYDIGKGTLSTTTSAVSSRITSDGYSSYLYGTFTDSASPSLSIVHSGHIYQASCPTTMFHVGESGWMNLPTPTSHIGWEQVVPITGLNLNETSVTLEQGDTIQLYATVTPSDATNPSLKWTSSNESIAMVSSAGLVTGKKGGETIITCAAQDGSGKTVTCQVTVSDEKTFTVSGVSFKMIRVEAGTFNMGASYAAPIHKVTISKDYYIGETEVTKELWMAVMGYHPGQTHPDVGENAPVNVTWKECQNFLTDMSSITGLNFRLPTEAEWEFAARGGNKSKGYAYAGSSDLDAVAWSYLSGAIANGYVYVRDVKLKLPNELGLYDMSGNASEYCSDWYGEYSSDAQVDPKGPDTGEDHVSRGGDAAYNTGDACRVAARDRNIWRTGCGIRLVVQF